MSLNWDGNRAERPEVEFKIEPRELALTDADGRKTGDTGERVCLLRRVKYRGGFSKWAFAGEFDDEAAAKTHAEGMV